MDGVKETASERPKKDIGRKRAKGRRKSPNKSRKAELVFVAVMLIVPIVHLLVFTVYVNFDTIFLTFQYKDTSTNTYRFLPDVFRNYKELFADMAKPYSTMPVAVKNSLIFFVLNDFIIVPVSVVLTYFLYKKIPCSGFFRIVFYFPSIISGVVLVMVYRFMFDSTIGVVDPVLTKLGLAGLIPEHGWLGTGKTALGMVIGYCIWSGLGGNLVLLSGAMSRVPQEIVESGKLDGVGFWGELWYFTVPMIGNTLSTLLILGTTVIFTFFLPIKLLTNGGPEGKTYTIALYIVECVRGDAGDLTMGATVGVVVTVFAVPIVMLSRFLAEKLFPNYEF